MGVLRQAAKLIIKEGLSKSLCPGEDRCLKFQTASSETVCEACPRNASKTKLFELENVEALIPWLNHLFYLYSLVKIGASFHVDDLTRSEWDGLLMLESVKAEIEHEKYDQERLKQKAAAAVAQTRRPKRR